MPTTRTFVAVFPPREVAAQVALAIDGLKRPDDGIAWIREPNLHYTLRFLGDLEPDRVDAARAATREAAAASTAFQVALGAAGAFPDMRRPKILWLGTRAGGEGMTALAASLERALGTRGFEADDRPYAPHLTVGRVRDHMHVRGWPGTAVFPRVEFAVTELLVVASTLAAGGSVYRPLERARLGSS